MYVPNSPRPTGYVLSSRHLRLLCPRDWDALIYIADALSNAEIAEKLHITPKSAENYRTRIGDKLQQKGVGKLSQFAEQHRAELRFWYEEITGKLPPPR